MREKAKLSLGRREWLAMAAGAILYGGLSWLTNIFPLQAAADLQIRPGVVVPIVFGFVFGPVVGFMVGAAGNFIGDLSSGLLPYAAAKPVGNAVLDIARGYLLNWQVGNGLMGLIPGVAAMYYRRYFTIRDQLRALLFAVAGVVCGMGFAAFAHTFVDPAVTATVAFNNYFLPLVRINLANAIVLVPILLFNYERFDIKSTEWLRSGLMRRLLLAILISAALPVALLGLFLTQQSMSANVDQTQLTVKLVFTVILTLLFTIANAGLLAQSMSRPLLRLTRSAQLMGTGNLSKDQARELEKAEVTDEIGILSQMFGRMAQEVIVREEKLKQQVQQLRIEIDESKKARQVAEITETDYFQSLKQKAKQFRINAEQ